MRIPSRPPGRATPAAILTALALVAGAWAMGHGCASSDRHVPDASDELRDLVFVRKAIVESFLSSELEIKPDVGQLGVIEAHLPEAEKVMPILRNGVAAGLISTDNLDWLRSQREKRREIAAALVQGLLDDPAKLASARAVVARDSTSAARAVECGLITDDDSRVLRSHTTAAGRVKGGLVSLLFSPQESWRASDGSEVYGSCLNWFANVTLPMWRTTVEREYGAGVLSQAMEWLRQKPLKDRLVYLYVRGGIEPGAPPFPGFRFPRRAVTRR